MCFGLLTRPGFTIAADALKGDVCLFPLFFFFSSPKNGSTCVNSHFARSPFLLLAVLTSLSHADFDRRSQSVWVIFLMRSVGNRLEAGVLGQPANRSLL